MKTRVISGVSFGLLALGIVFFSYLPLLDIAVYVLSLMAVYELIKVFDVKNKLVYILGMGFSALTITYLGYSHLFDFKIDLSIPLVIYVIGMLSFVVADFGKTTFQQISMTIFSSITLPAALACFIRFKNLIYYFDDLIIKEHAKYLIWFCLAGAVFGDTFALFAGVKFGKHKLCPRISPKKTVEGFVGGIVGSAAINIISLVIANQIFAKPFPIPVWIMAIVSLVIPVIGTLGDLAASSIKRNYGIKDFGNIIPGHGGIMDRMDSISFVAPCVYGLVIIALNIYSA